MLNKYVYVIFNFKPLIKKQNYNKNIKTYLYSQSIKLKKNNSYIGDII